MDKYLKEKSLDALEEDMIKRIDEYNRNNRHFHEHACIKLSKAVSNDSTGVYIYKV